MNLPDKFLENAQISNFMKIRPVGAELFRMDTRVREAIRNFANAPKNAVAQNHSAQGRRWTSRWHGSSRFSLQCLSLLLVILKVMQKANMWLQLKRV